MSAPEPRMHVTAGIWQTWVSASGRLRGAGTFARIGTIVPLCVLGAALAIGTAATQKRDAWFVVALVLLATLAVAAVRSVFIGVWLLPDRFVARTWFRTVSISKPDLVSCTTERYGGFFTKGWTVSYLRELKVGLADHHSYVLGGTVAFAAKSATQRQVLLDYMVQRGG